MHLDTTEVAHIFILAQDNVLSATTYSVSFYMNADGDVYLLSVEKYVYN